MQSPSLDKPNPTHPPDPPQVSGGVTAGLDVRVPAPASDASVPLGSPEGAITVAIGATLVREHGPIVAKPREIPAFDELRYQEKMRRARTRWEALARGDLAAVAALYLPDGCSAQCRCKVCKPFRGRLSRDRRRCAVLRAAVLPSTCSLSCPSSCPRCRDFRSLQYAKARALATAQRMRPRLDECGKDEVAVACQCGPRAVKVRCRQRWVCKACQVAFSAKREPMIRDALVNALDDEHREWGRRGGKRGGGQQPAIYLLTVSHAHTGDIGRDLEVLSSAWRTFSKSMHREWGRAPYVGTWELTPGRCTTCNGYPDGKGGRARCACDRPTPEGHLHLHVAVVWWRREWDRVSELWRAACPSSRGIDIRELESSKASYQPASDLQVAPYVAKYEPGQASAVRPVRRSTLNAAKSAAHYIAKYITKGADGRGYTPMLRADVCAAFYNRHSFVTSSEFWMPENKCCRKCEARIRRVQTIAPELWDSLAASTMRGYKLDGTGPPVEIRVPVPMYYLKRAHVPGEDVPAPYYVYLPGEEERARELRDAAVAQLSTSPSRT
jgi:hypothetical protein